MSAPTLRSLIPTRSALNSTVATGYNLAVSEITALVEFVERSGYVLALPAFPVSQADED